MSLARNLARVIVDSSGDIAAGNLDNAVPADGSITAAKLAATLDLSSKTLSYPDASVSTSDLETAAKPIGVGQTWQNMIASRAAGTTYTNTTGRPIQIVVCATTATQFTIFEMDISGLSMLFGRAAFSGSSDFSTITLTIPNDATYRLVTGSINNWLELR
jgi:hypothetical protein